MYLPVDGQWDGKSPEPKENMAKELQDKKDQAAQSIDGFFRCVVVWGHTIPIGDTDKKSTDPYVKVFFPNKGKGMKTKTIKNTRNPIWGQANVLKMEHKMKKNVISLL